MANENALGALYNNKIRYNRYDTFINGYAEVTLTDYLKLRSQGSFQLYNYDSYSYTHFAYGCCECKGKSFSKQGFGETINWTNSLDFNKSFGKHNVNAQAIFELMDYRYDALSAQGTGFYQKYMF